MLPMRIRVTCVYHRQLWLLLERYAARRLGRHSLALSGRFSSTAGGLRKVRNQGGRPLAEDREVSVRFEEEAVFTCNAPVVSSEWVGGEVV